MTVGILVRIPGGTKEQYEQVAAEIFPGGQLPEGGLLHIAGPREDGWQVVNVWESEEGFRAFAEERIRPATQRAGEAAPEFSFFPVKNLIQSEAAGPSRRRN